jgi:DNA-binding response OmpR family regulator
MVANLNIVLVEDNDDLRELTCQVLSQDGHHITGLACAEELEDLAGGDTVDIFLIDLNLPGEDGISLAQRIRKAHPLVGIIIVSARSDLDDKLIGYDSGADWYITKPLVFAELSAAIKSYARKRHAALQNKQASDQSIKLEKLQLSGPLGIMKSTGSESVLLTAFARAPGGKLETWQIAEILAVEVNEAMKNSIAVRIARLRKKLIDVGAPGLVIESIRNTGYRLLIDLEVL